MTAKEKMTAPIASVSADVEQPSSNKLTNQSIADLPGKGNLQATNNAENTAKSANKNNPDNLETVSMMELYDTAYPPKLPIIDGLSLEWKKRETLSSLLKWWNDIPMAFDITTVGTVLAHANAQRCDSSIPPLE